MARWQLQANKEEETAGGGGSFKPAPRGIYTIQVANTKDGKTKTHRDMVSLECEIADQGPEFGKKVWLTVTAIPQGEKGHGIMVHALHAFGLEYHGALDFDTDAFQGMSARALLGIKPYPKVVNGRTYNNEINYVETLYSENHPEPTTLPPVPVVEPNPANRIGETKQPDLIRDEIEEVPF